MTPAHRQILQVLLGHLSAMNAEGLLLRAIREAGLAPESVGLGDLPELVPSIERRARLYIDATRLARLREELVTLGGVQPPRRARSVPVRTENDISEARMTAKAVCDGAGARGYIGHKVATIVSELARNIVHYTPGGAIEIVILREGRARCVVVALDQGPGIGNVDEVLAGRYRSKTGMGRGLLGVKRLADRFEIDTGAKGTRIEAEVYL